MAGCSPVPPPPPPPLHEPPINVCFVLRPVGLDVTREEITTQLSSIGFTDEMLETVITSLSGGWKMKLALARAMLMKVRLGCTCGGGG